MHQYCHMQDCLELVAVVMLLLILIRLEYICDKIDVLYTYGELHAKLLATKL